MKTDNDLRELLGRIDRKSYPAYKSAKGSYRFKGYILVIDHVQGDPFAAPSSLHIEVPASTGKFPSVLYDEKHKRVALQDALIREFGACIRKFSFQAKGSGKSGIISMTGCGQEILERSACEIDPDTGDILVRFEAGFPANGRTINAGELVKMLFDFLPKCVYEALRFERLDQDKIRKVMELAVDREAVLTELRERGLVAFVANGSILPRESGVSEKPMKNAVPFMSPKSMEVTLELPYRGTITGMGISRGITLIVGGGYHGKSTLLKALERGIYPHISGDGREYIVTDENGMKIRAEDGRSIKNTNISLFINDLPNGKKTESFSTEDASGSTSQAANVMEAIEAGATTLYIDEDTSATNFMVRDELMQQVIHRDQEPITPFVERMRGLFEKWGISTVLVAGSSGTYFHVADTIIQMDRYEPIEITAVAKEAAKKYSAPQELSMPEQPTDGNRCPKPNKNLEYKGRIKIKTLGKDGVSLNNEHIDLRYVEQLVDAEQLTCLGFLTKYIEEHMLDGKKSIKEVADDLFDRIRQEGFKAVCAGDVPGNLCLPRKLEFFACVNRYRSLNLR